MKTEAFPRIEHRIDDGRLILVVDSSVYSLNAVLRTCYKFTDRHYAYIERCRESQRLLVLIIAKSGTEEVAQVSGEFFNELLDQELRERIEDEVGELRDLIVTQAFSEGNLLVDDYADPDEDRSGIGRHRTASGGIA